MTYLEMVQKFRDDNADSPILEYMLMGYVRAILDMMDVLPCGTAQEIREIRAIVRKVRDAA